MTWPHFFTNEAQACASREQKIQAGQKKEGRGHGRQEQGEGEHVGCEHEEQEQG